MPPIIPDIYPAKNVCFSVFAVSTPAKADFQEYPNFQHLTMVSPLIRPVLRAKLQAADCNPLAGDMPAGVSICRSPGWETVFVFVPDSA